MANNGSVWINLLMDYMDKTHLDKINEIFTKYEEKIFATNYNFDEIKNLIKQYIPEMLDSDYKILEARLNNIRQTVLDKIREAENITLSAADFQDDFSSVTEVNVVEKREKLLKAIEADITHDTPVGTEMFQEKNDAFYEHRSPYYTPTVNVSLFGDLLGLKKFIDTDVNDKTWESYIKERVKVIKFPIDSNIKVLEFGLHFTQNVYNIASNYDQIQKTNRDFTGRIYLSNLLEEDKAIECRLIIYNADNSPFKHSETSVGPEFYFKCFRKDGYVYLFCDEIEIFRLLPIWRKDDVANYLNFQYPNNSYKFDFGMPDAEEVVMIDPDGHDQNGIFSSSSHGFGRNGTIAWNSYATAETTSNGIVITRSNGFIPMNILYRDRYNEMNGGPMKKRLSNFDLFVKNRYYLSKAGAPDFNFFMDRDPKMLGNLISNVGIFMSNAANDYTKAASVANYLIIDKENELEDIYATFMKDGKSSHVGFLDPFPDQAIGSTITVTNTRYLSIKNTRTKKTFGDVNDSLIISAGDGFLKKVDGSNNYQFYHLLFIDTPNAYFLYREGSKNTRFEFVPIYSYYRLNDDYLETRLYEFEPVQVINAPCKNVCYKKQELEKERLKLDISLEEDPSIYKPGQSGTPPSYWMLKVSLNGEPVTDESELESITITPATGMINKVFERQTSCYRITPLNSGVAHVSIKATRDSWISTIKECVLTMKKYSTLTCDRMGFCVSAREEDEKNKQKINLTYTTFTFEYEIRDLDIIEFDKNTTTVKGLKPGNTTLTIRVQEDGYALPEEKVIAIKVLESTTQTGDTPINLTDQEVIEILNGVASSTVHKGQFDYEIEMSEIQEILVEDDSKNLLEELWAYNGLIDKRYNSLILSGYYFRKFNSVIQGYNNDKEKNIRYETQLDWTPSTVEKMGDKWFVYGVKTDKTDYYKKPIGGFDISYFPSESRLENYLFLNGRKIDITAYPEYEPLYNAYKEARYLTEEGEAHDTYLELDIPETTLEEPLVINRYQSKEILVTSNAHDYTITNDPANANFVTNAKLTDKFGFTLTGAAIGSQKLIIKATSTSGSTVTKEVFVKCIEENLTYIDNLVEQIIINGINGGFNSKIVHFYTDAEYTGSNGNTFTATGMQNGVTVSEWKDNGPILAKGPNGEELRDISFKIYYPFNAAHAFPQKQNITISVKNEVAKKKINSYVVDLRITKETPSFGFLTPTHQTTELLTCDDNIYSWPEELTVNKQHVIWFIECINPENYVNYDYYCEVTATNPNAIQVTKHNEVDFTLTPLQKGFNTVTWKITKDDIVYKKTLQFKCKELTELSTSLDTDNIELWPAKNTVIDVITNANDFTFEVKDETKATAVKVNNQLSITSLDIGSTELVIKATADDGIQNTLTIPINVVPVPHTRLEVDVTELTLDLGFNQRLTIDTEAEEWEYEILSGADYLNLVKTNDTTLVVQATEIGESRIKIKAQHGELVESSIEIPVTVKYVDTELSIGTRTEYEILKDETLVFEITTNAADFTYIEDVDLVETPDTENPDVENPDGQDPDQEQQPEQEIKKKRLKFTKGRGKLTVQGINPGNQKFSVSATATNGDTKTIEVTIDVFEETTTFEISPESTKRILKLGETQVFTINNSANDYTVIIPDDVKDCLSYDKAKHTLSCTKVCDTTLTFEAKEDGKKKIVKEVKVSANYPFADLNLTEDQIKSRVENLDQLFIDLHTNRTNREEYNKVIDKLKNSFPEANFIVDEESVPAFQLSETTKATLEKYKTTVPTLEEYNNEIQEYYNAMPRSLNLSVDDITLNNLKTLNDASVYINDAAQCTSVKKHNDQLSTLLKNTTKWRFVDHSYKTDIYQRIGNCKVGLGSETISDDPSAEEFLTHIESLNAHLTKLRDNCRNYFTLKSNSEFKSNIIANNYTLSPIVMLKGEILDEDGNPPDQLSGKSVRTFDTTPWVEKDYISEITMTNSNPDVVDVEVAENLKSITFTHKNAGKGESDVEFTLKRVVEIHPTELEVDKDNLEFTLIAPPKKEEIVTPEEGDGSETNPDIDGGEQEVSPPIESDPVDQPTEEETVEQESQYITFTTNAPTFTLEAEDPDQDIVEIVIETGNPDVKAAKITPIKEGTITLIAKATAKSDIPTTEYKEATIEITITVNPPVEEIIPPIPEIPAPDPDQGELTPDQGTEETPEVSPDGEDNSEPQVQADEGTDEGPVVDPDGDGEGETEEGPGELPEEPESKIETVEYTQTVNVRVMSLQDTNSQIVFEELFNKDKKFTLYKFDNSTLTEDQVLIGTRAFESVSVMGYNTIVLDNLMDILEKEFLELTVPQYKTWTGQWPVYKLLPAVTLDEDDTKTEDELISIAYENVQLSTIPEHLKKVEKWNKDTLKSLNDFCQNVANKDEFIKENVLYKGAKMDTSTTSIDNAGREHNLSLVNNIINKYKNEFTNASEIKYTGKLYHILATGTWDPVIVKKNRHQLMSIEMCYKNILPKHIEFKLLDSKDMKKINTKKIYANEVWFDHDDLGEDLLPFGEDPIPARPLDEKLSVGLDLQSVLEYIYLKYSTDEKISLIDTSNKYRVNMKYRASDFAYDVGGTDNDKKNVMVAVTRLIKSLLHNNNDQTKNETKVDIDIFEKPINDQATDIYFEDNYRIGVNTVGDLIKWMNDQKDSDMRNPYMGKRTIQAYRLDPRYIDTPEGEKIYDTNGRKCYYSEDMGRTWKYSEEDVLPYGIDIEDGGWVSTRNLDETVIVLFSNVYPCSIFRSYDGLHFEEIKVRNPYNDKLNHWNDVRINKDATNIMCMDSHGNTYTSTNDDWTEFRLFEDITRNGRPFDYRLLYPIDDHESRKGMGFLYCSSAEFGMWFHNMRENCTYILDAENRIYPRMKLGDRIQPNYTFDLKYINSDMGSAFKRLCVSKKVWENVLTTNNPMIDGQGVEVKLFAENGSVNKTKFGVDFELLLSLSDTSVFSTDYQFDILDRGDIIDLIEEMKHETIQFDIKPTPIGFIQLDGFDYSGSKINKTGPYLLRKQFINFYTDIDENMTRYVNKDAATIIKEIKDYIEDRITMSGYNHGLVQIQVTSIFDFQANSTAAGVPVAADPKRAEIEPQRKFYTTWNAETPQTTPYDYNYDHSIDGIEFDIIGVHSLDVSETSYIRYFKDLARVRNWIKNLIQTMDDIKIWYDLDNEFLKKAFFPDDEKVKLSELVNDPFINMDDSNFFKYPLVIMVTIYPTDVQSFVNYRQKINRDLYNKYEKDGDIITTKTDILFNKEE